MFVKAFVVVKKNQLRMQSLIKIVLTFNLIKTNKKNVFKLLNAIKKFANKIIIKIVKQYLLFVFLNFIRFKNFFLIKNALSHIKFYAHKKSLEIFFKKKLYLLLYFILYALLSFFSFFLIVNYFN
jgi:hypothetical protein